MVRPGGRVWFEEPVYFSLPLFGVVIRPVFVGIPLMGDLKVWARRCVAVLGSRLVGAFTRVGVSANVLALSVRRVSVEVHRRERARIEQVEVDQLRKNVSDFLEMLESICELIIIDIMDELDRLDDS